MSRCRGSRDARGSWGCAGPQATPDPGTGVTELVQMGPSSSRNTFESAEPTGMTGTSRGNPTARNAVSNRRPAPGSW